ncbi:MAG: hypothetical protein E3J70_08640 [Candidatus Heimdallarchaeota archaeon]|nr:MAG: hypothetical protein E3J70_08640 [Candidatus Heimdallarchaeota archaeon]
MKPVEAKTNYPNKLELISNKTLPITMVDIFYSWAFDEENSRVFIKYVNGFSVINCSNPSNPVVEGSYVYWDDSFIREMYYFDNKLFVKIGFLHNDITIHVFDVSDSQSISKIGEIEDGYLYETYGMYFVEDGNYAIHIGRDAIACINISDPSLPSIVSTIGYFQFDQDQFGIKRPYCKGLAIHPIEKLFMFALFNFNSYSGNRVFMFDFTDITNLTRVNFNHPENSYFEYLNDFCYLENNDFKPYLRRNYQVELLNWSDPLNPIVTTRFSFPDGVNDYSIDKSKNRILAYFRAHNGNTALFGLNESNDFIQLSETLADTEGVHSLYAPYFKDDYIYCLDVFEIQTTNHPLSIWKIVKDNKIRNRNLVIVSTIGALILSTLLIALPKIIKKRRN